MIVTDSPSLFDKLQKVPTTITIALLEAEEDLTDLMESKLSFIFFKEELKEEEINKNIYYVTNSSIDSINVYSLDSTTSFEDVLGGLTKGTLSFLKIVSCKIQVDRWYNEYVESSFIMFQNSQGFYSPISEVDKPLKSQLKYSVFKQDVIAQDKHLYPGEFAFYISKMPFLRKIRKKVQQVELLETFYKEAKQTSKYLVLEEELEPVNKILQ